MNEKYIKQIRLTDGTEIITELIEEYEQEVIIRCPLRVVKIDISIEKSVYTFKPYMTYTEFTDNLISLNWDHVIAIAIPHEDLVGQYLKAYRRIQRLKKDEDVPYSTEEKELRNIMTDVKSKLDIKDEDLKDFMVNETSGDSTPSNVIYVPFSTDKDKMH